MTRQQRRAAERDRKKFTGSSLAGTALALGAMGIAMPGGADAATYTVANRLDAGPGSLRAAVANANANPGLDTIVFASTVAGNIVLTSGQISINDSVRIAGPSAAKVSVDGDNASRIFYVYAAGVDIDVSISGLTLMNGNSAEGGAIVNYGENLSLTGVKLLDNTASGSGGALWMDGGDLAIRSCTISGNVAGGDGGGIGADDVGDVTLASSVFANNVADEGGGGIYLGETDGQVNINKCRVTGNTATGEGGGVHFYDTDGGDVLFVDTVISGNFAGTDGGGVYFYSPDDPITFTRCTISGNAAISDGGGIYMYASTSYLTFNSCTISGNSAGGDGGGIYFYDTPNYDLVFNDCTISGNVADNDGGGIYFYDTSGPVTFNRTSISGNVAGGDGGGIYFYDTDDDVLFSQCTIAGNMAGGDGGGLWGDFGGFVTIQRSTISGNMAGSDGGGIFFYDATYEVSIENSTISGNTAIGNGGGVYLYSAVNSGYVGFNFCTIAGNSADTGGGVYASVDVWVDNSIIADNKAWTDPDISGGDFLSNYSLFENPGASTGTDFGGCLFDVDPGLAKLASNGGPTKTMKIGLGASPAINAADPAFVAPPATDQRGVARVRGGRADMGAVER